MDDFHRSGEAEFMGGDEHLAGVGRVRLIQKFHKRFLPWRGDVLDDGEV
jgi:hypothetical protein